MMFDNRFLAAAALILAGIGAAVAFALWAFRLVPAWTILAAAIGLPLTIIAIIALLLFAGWMASGSH